MNFINRTIILMSISLLALVHSVEGGAAPEKRTPAQASHERVLNAELQVAILHGDAQKVKDLLARGADINDGDNKNAMTPLLIAIEQGKTAIARSLIEAGADVNAKDWMHHSALYYARQRHERTLIALLLKRGARP